MTLRHTRFTEGRCEFVRVATCINGKQYGCEVPVEHTGIMTATLRAESNLRDYLQRNKIHARNPGEADG